MKKLQAAAEKSSNLQAPEKFQAPNIKPGARFFLALEAWSFSGAWNLEVSRFSFLWSLEVGIWNLGSAPMCGARLCEPQRVACQSSGCGSQTRAPISNQDTAGIWRFLRLAASSRTRRHHLAGSVNTVGGIRLAMGLFSCLYFSRCASIKITCASGDKLSVFAGW